MANWMDDFMNQVEVGKGDECWNWKGKTNCHGYGIFYRNSTLLIASRVMYEHHMDVCLSGTNLGRSCGNRKCVNPAHMTPGRHKTGSRASLTHCRYGHELSGGNLISFQRGGITHHRCNTCMLQSVKEYEEYLSHRNAHTGAGDTQAIRGVE